MYCAMLEKKLQYTRDQNLYLEMGWLTAPLNTVPKAMALMSPLGYRSDSSMFEEFVFP